MTEVFPSLTRWFILDNMFERNLGSSSTKGVAGGEGPPDEESGEAMDTVVETASGSSHVNPTGGVFDLVEDALGKRELSALDWVELAYRALGRVEVEGLCRSDREELASGLARVGSVAASGLCRVAESTSASEPGIDVGEMLRQATGLSARETKDMVVVASELRDMPEVAERFASGKMTFGHVKALAAAAQEVGAEMVNQQKGLLDLAGGLPSDTFRRRVRNWATRVMLDAGVDQLDRQRQARRGAIWTDWRTGMRVLRFELDPVNASLVEQAIDGRFRKLWLADSGGGQDPDDVRTPAQRLADAFFEKVTKRDSFSYEALPGGDGKTGSSVLLVLTADVAVIDGTDPDGTVEVLGVGPVPRRMLETLSPDTELVSMIFAGSGRVLWMGRKTRLGNTPQRLAVAIRDGGCFECGAPMHRCQLHHIREWHRDQGPTDVDNLVAVCPKHHRWLTDNNLQVHRAGHGWETRPRDGPSP